MTTWCFDLDGTLADLYNSENWLENLENEKSGVFLKLPLLLDADAFKRWAVERLAIGDKIEVITWLPRGASDEYERICADEKTEWVKKHFPFISEIHCLSYGVPKQYAIKKRSALMILIDDNEEVLQMWKTNVHRNGILASDFINEYL